MAGTILPAINLVLNLSAFSIEYIDALKFCWEKSKKYILKVNFVVYMVLS